METRSLARTPKVAPMHILIEVAEGDDGTPSAAIVGRNATLGRLAVMRDEMVDKRYLAGIETGQSRSAAKMLAERAFKILRIKTGEEKDINDTLSEFMEKLARRYGRPLPKPPAKDRAKETEPDDGPEPAEDDGDAGKTEHPSEPADALRSPSRRPSTAKKPKRR